MSAIPLVAGPLTDRITWRGGRAVTRGELLLQVTRLAATLPPARYALNLCRNRHAFLVGFAAACLRGQISLLPWSDAPASVQQTALGYPDHHVLDDRTIDRAPGEEQPLPANLTTASPDLDSEQRVAIVFTSGTTGAPQPHPKTWGELCATAAAVARHFAPGLNVVATVPAQHMYGLETTIALACASTCSFHEGRPFFPEDIRAALESIPAPRALITTPAHLRVCLESQVRFAPLELILCATAALESGIAAQAEFAWSTALYEIYGSTEAGVMATRRTALGAEWHLLPGAKVLPLGDKYQYVAGHLAAPVELHDLVTLTGTGRFLLRGRSSDVVKVAGKRISLQELTERLRGVPGVSDCVVFQPDPEGRPAALVVAAGPDTRAIAASLEEHLDPAFVPRPLVLVDALPRNEVGKFERAALLAAIGRRIE